MINCSKIPLQDKGCHLIIGFIVALSVGLLAYFLGYDYPQQYGVLAGVIAGVGKEVRDYLDYGKFSFFDMFATFIGTFFGGLVVTML